MSDYRDYLDNLDLDIFKRILSYNLNATTENVLLLGDNGLNTSVLSPVLTNALKLAAEELGLKHRMILQNPVTKGEEADKKIVNALKELPKNSIILMNMSDKLGKLGSLGLSFRKFCQANNHRFTSASGWGAITNDKINNVMESLDIDYQKLSDKANKIKKILDEANELHITTDKGTNLKYNIEGMKSLVSDGLYRKPGQGGNLPGSEVYVPPKKNNVNGTIVIDGSYRTRKGTKLIETPIEMKIKNGEIAELNDCKEAQELEETLQWAYSKAKHPWGIRRIGEFGIGLNPKAKVIGCTVIDEKTLGTGHFAIGSNYWFGGSIYAIIHLDQVFFNPIIKVDGKLIKIS